MYTAASGSQATADRPRKRPAEGARRILLLQTTLRLIGDRGVDGITHRSVAEAAGVSLGSTTYWFASRQDMVREALEYFAQLEIEGLREHLAGVLESPVSPRRVADAFTQILVSQLGEQRWRTVAQYTLLQEAAREPELEPVCREWTQAWTQSLQEVFESLDAMDPALEARMFLALLDGLLLNQLATPDPDVETAVIKPTLRAWLERMPNRR